MDNRLILNVGSLSFQVNQEVSVELSPSQFKILYQFFLKKMVYYEDIPFSHGATKVHMVDIKRILPAGTYDNIRGEGYKPSLNWTWEIKA